MTIDSSTHGLRILALLGLALIASAPVWRAEPADAAFPGTNGLIAFVSDRTTGAGVNNPTGDLEIFTIDPTDSRHALTQLTDNTSNDYQPAFSPDGQRIAFRSVRDGNSEIYVMDADGQNQVRLTNNAVYDAQPTFSPDGTKIAFVSDRDGNNLDVYKMSSSDGSDQVRLTKKSAADDGSPAWSPDGAKIAFVSNRSGNNEIYVMKARPEGKKNRPRNLSRHSSAEDLAPDWSPDGKQLAFYSNRGIGSDYEVYKMNADGSNQTQLTENQVSDSVPAFSPDGTKIAFVSDRDGDNEVYTMDADGSNQTNISNDPGIDHQPDWQPL